MAVQHTKLNRFVVFEFAAMKPPIPWAKIAMISWVTDENQRTNQVEQNEHTQDTKIRLSAINAQHRREDD